MIRPSFRPLRPGLCRERHGSQGDPSGSFADLDSRAFLPVMKNYGRGTETPLGACSGNIPQRQNQSPAVAGLHKTTACKICINSHKIVFAAFCHSRVVLRVFAPSGGPWGCFFGASGHAVPIPGRMPLPIATSFAVVFCPVFAFHAPALFPRASIPVVPTGYCRGWRVALPPRPPKKAERPKP